MIDHYQGSLEESADRAHNVTSVKPVIVVFQKGAYTEHGLHVLRRVSQMQASSCNELRHLAKEDDVLRQTGFPIWQAVLTRPKRRPELDLLGGSAGNGFPLREAIITNFSSEQGRAMKT